jgi:two-component system, NarL family, response regulator DevR
MIIRVLIIDDHPVVRKGVRGLLGEYPDVEVVGESSGGQDAIHLCRDLKPDVILLDIKLDSEDGLSLYTPLRRVHPAVKIIMLTGFDDDIFLQKALKLGVQGYLLKSSSPEILMEIIRAVYNGERRISNSLMDAALRSIEQISLEKDIYGTNLTEEEIRLMQLLASGASNQKIAEQLYLSERTVKRKLHELMDKLDANTRAMVVSEGYKRGIL